jgi:hypothetical protein
VSKKTDKIVEIRDDDWEIESAMETLKRYAKLVEDKKLKEEAIKKLSEEADKYKKVVKDLK